MQPCRRPRRRICSLLVLSFVGIWGVLFLFPSFVLSPVKAAEQETGEEEEEEEGEEEESEEDQLYLYNSRSDRAVLDYHGTGKDNDKPDFLYSTSAGPRIVEFYAPWCPHCQHFHPQYAQFAKQIQALTNNKVKVYAVSCTANKPICRDWDINGYPIIKTFKAGSINSTQDLQYWKIHPFRVLKSLDVVFQEDQFLLESAAAADTTTSELDSKKKISLSRFRKAKIAGDNKENEENDKMPPKKTKVDVFSDAYLSFHFALQNAIYMTTGPLTNKTRTAFYDWLDLCSKAMPPTWQIQALISDLLKDFDAIATSDEKLNEIVQKYPPKTKTWSEFCTHGEKGMGYTCGLWELFHIMTVGVVEWNLMMSEDDNSFIDTDRAAEVLRNYIENFFGCEVCRINFMASYDSCAHDRCHRLHKTEAYDRDEWMQLPLWLFETHNAVNVRLVKEKARRQNTVATTQDEIDRTWPAKEDCPKCWRGEDRAWDEENIYKYLRLEYWPEDGISKIYRRELFGDASSKEKGDDEYDYARTTRVPLQLVPVGIVFGLLFGWYVKKKELRRTGRHKRIS